jgi:hypothetical protein
VVLKMNQMNKTVSTTTTISTKKYEKENYLPFKDKWNLYYHATDDTKWDLQSYTLIMKDIYEPEQLISINESIPENIVKNTMLFVMRKPILPIWEDERNRTGGYISFKIINKYILPIWKSIFYATCGETLFKTREHNQYVNGISISPKKVFCIIKIWLSDCNYKDSEFNPITYLSTTEIKFTPFSETS